MPSEKTLERDRKIENALEYWAANPDAALRAVAR